MVSDYTARLQGEKAVLDAEQKENPSEICEEDNSGEEALLPGALSP